MTNRTTTVGVVVCAYDLGRWDDLCAAIKSIDNQSRRADEVVLVIDHNPDLLDRARAEFEPSVEVIPNADTRGLSGARNTGWRSTTTELVAFLDDDARADESWLTTLIGHYEDPSTVGVGGRAVAAWDAGAPLWFPPAFGWVVGCSYDGQPTAAGTVRNLMGCNMSFRREALSSCGGFRSDLGRVGRLPLGCEETELCIRVSHHHQGVRFVHDPEAVVHHRVRSDRSTVGYFLRRCRAEGRSKAMVARYAGPQSALSAERDYTAKVLPRAMIAAAGDLGSSPRRSIGQIAAVLSGVALAAYGFAEMRFLYASGRAR